MRSLFLLLLVLLFGPLASAHGGGEMDEHEGVEVRDAVMEHPSPQPVPRPALVTGEVTTPRFRILHTARSEQAAKKLAGEIEGVRDSFGQMLGHDWPGVTEIRLGVGRAEFEALALPGGQPPRWAAALAYPAHAIVLLDALGLNGEEGPTTLRHELAHVALGQLGKKWPRWFQEGLAQDLTGERLSMTQYAALFRAVTQERVYHFDTLEDGWPDIPSDVEIAYAQSAAFVAYLEGRHGAGAMGKLVDGVGAGQPFEVAFINAFGNPLVTEETDWRNDLSARYGWMPFTTSVALVWLAASVLVIPAYLFRRKRKAEKMELLAAEDAAEDAALRLLAAEAEQQGASLPPETLSPEWAGELPPVDPSSVIVTNDDDGETSDGGSERPGKPTLH